MLLTEILSAAHIRIPLIATTRNEAIRELLDNDEAPASAIQAYLDEHFPAYSPLTDWVKEA